MCKYCEKPNMTIVTHISGVLAFVGAGLLWLRYYDKKRNKTFANTAAINYCPMCGRDLRSNNGRNFSASSV